MREVSNILPYFKNKLKTKFSQREIISLAYITIENFLGFNRSDCILNANQKIDKDKRAQIIKTVSELRINKPIQYILGITDFYGLRIRVSNSVLIPRPETEELVDWIIEGSSGKSNFLDIGTGSGCIIISLNRHLKGNFFGIDISKKALKIAEKNNQQNQTNVNFYEMDIIYDDFPENTFFDVIVSNPPYVLISEKESMKKNVLDFEPNIALFVEDNEPLLFYKVIARKAKKILNKEGLLYFEINEKYGSQILDVLSSEGFVNIELKKDINDKDRMIKAMWK